MGSVTVSLQLKSLCCPGDKCYFQIEFIFPSPLRCYLNQIQCSLLSLERNENAVLHQLGLNELIMVLVSSRSKIFSANLLLL